MQAKSILKLVLALVPVIYCAGLVFYFMDVTGSVEGTWGIGLGPTVLGLGVIGLLFCIPLLLKLFRALSGPGAPKSDGQGGPTTPPRKHNDEEESGIDPDAAIARYMARQAAEAAVPAAASRASSGPAKPGGFGQRNR